MDEISHDESGSMGGGELSAIKIAVSHNVFVRRNEQDV